MSIEKLFEQKLGALMDAKLAVVGAMLDKTVGRLLASVASEPATAVHAAPPPPQKPKAKEAAAKAKRGGATDKVLESMTTAPLGFAAIAKASGCANGTLRQALAKLVDTGKLVKYGVGRGVTYARPQ